MFTGIIEDLGEVVGIEEEQTNLHFDIKSKIAKELKIDQSLAHNGVCLTVVNVSDDVYRVTAIKETLDKSNLGKLVLNKAVNLERCMELNGRLDGHMVQGHVDQTGTVKDIQVEDGSWVFTIEYNPNGTNITVEKGSITVNGVSLTVINSKKGQFSVAIIPFTYEHTTFQYLKVGDTVNLEFDILGKYIAQYMNQLSPQQ